MAGIAAADAAYPHVADAAWMLLLGAVAAAFGAVCAHKRPSLLPSGRPDLFGLFVLLFFFFLGAERLVESRNRTCVEWPRRSYVTTRAVIVETPREGRKSVGMVVCLADGPWRHQRVRLTLPTANDDRTARLKAGYVLSLSMCVEQPHNFGENATFDYAAYLRRQGIAGQAYCPARWWRLLPASTADSLRATLPLATRLRTAAIQLRDRLAERYTPHLEGEALGVVAAMTLGDKRFIDRSTRDVYSLTGTSHVLALSGLHLSILFALIRLVVLRQCRRPAARTVVSLLTLLAFWAYALLAGLPLSLVRATTMYSLLILAGLSSRGYSSLNSLATAALLILVVSPQALFDVGFQLSFLSVAALLLVLPLLTPAKSGRTVRWFTSFVTLPVCAQVAVAPLVAYYFHTVPLYFLPANLVAVPASSAILALGVVFFLLPWPPLQAVVGTALGLTTQAMNFVLGHIARWPGACIDYRPTLAGVALAYAGLCLAVAALATRRRIYTYAWVGAFTLALCTEMYAHSPIVKKTTESTAVTLFSVFLLEKP